MQTKFFTAKNDKMFKAIFCNSKNISLLTWLIHKCLNKNVSIIKVLSPELAKNNIYDKGKILDVLIEADGKIINLEMNSNYYSALHNRNASYLFNRYIDDIKVGESYGEMHEIWQINFTSNLPKEYPALGKYYFIDPETKIKFIDNLICYEFNVEKIKENCYNGDEKFNFIAMLDFNEEELKKYCVGDKNMEKFKDEVIRLNNDTKFIEFLSAEEDAKRVQNSLLLDAESKGMAIGEANKSIEIAKNLLSKGLDEKTILETTGITKEKFEDIKNLS